MIVRVINKVLFGKKNLSSEKYLSKKYVKEKHGKEL